MLFPFVAADVVPVQELERLFATLSQDASMEAIADRCSSLLPTACRADEVTLLVERALERSTEGRRFGLRGAPTTRA